jgi:photosystem II stability/assembly factor-like uncharacterized protein
MHPQPARGVYPLSAKAPLASLTTTIALLCAIPALAAPPTTVYAGGTGGVYRSTNGGATWSSSLLPGVSVTAIAIDPLNANVIYAAGSVKIGSSYVPAVNKSTNGGSTWTAETNGLASAFVITSLQIDPSNPNIIYLSSGGAAFGSGVFKSTDGGVHWSAVNNGLNCTGMGCILSVQQIALDPLNVNTLYATGQTGFVTSKTTNAAASWSPTTFPGGFGFSIGIDPVQDSIVLISGPFGIWKSTDGGGTWTTNLEGGFFWYLAIDPNTPSIMYADASVGSGVCAPYCPTQTNTVYKSTDTGDHWAVVGALPSVNVDSAQVGPLVIDPADTSTLYLGGGTGVSKSTDSGATWNLVMPGTGINALAMAPNALQTGFFTLFETLAQDAIAVANDFKGDPTIACGILKGYLDQIPGLVSAGLLSSGQGQALTLQVTTAEASIPCP